ncbi:MAG: hypothetical protein ACK6C4_00680, partial [Bacteroidota bacterium]
PLFRRVSMNQTLMPQSSFLPHLEVSALSGVVDLAALDAENEQIFRDATKGTLRIETPTHCAVMGPLSGQIINMSGMSVEQTTPAPHAMVAIASQSGKPLSEADRALLTISTRALNEGAVFNADNLNLRVWGKGPVQMEGVGVRFTITSPAYDTLVIRPLGPDGRPAGQPIGVSPRSGGRFTALVNTAEHRTPWYRLEFNRRTTSVDGEAAPSLLAVLNNGSGDDRLLYHLEAPAAFVGLVDARGALVVTGGDDVGTSSLDVARLATGIYQLVVRFVSGESRTAPVLIP